MDADFPRLVSLACHDLRTPLAAVQGFAKTLLRGQHDDTTTRWLGLIDEASTELAALVDLVSLAARLEDGRYDPVLREVDSLQIARSAVPDATGTGAPVGVDVEPVTRAVADLVRAAERHGGVTVAVTVDGPRVALEPVVAEAAPIVLAEDAKELGAAVAVRLLAALGGTLELDGERLNVTLPPPPADT